MYTTSLWSTLIITTAIYKNQLKVSNNSLIKSKQNTEYRFISGFKQIYTFELYLFLFSFR